MTEHADHRFSATLSTHDLALVGCLRALADFSQRNISPESTEERDWRAAGQQVTFGFSRALDRDLFKNEVRRLLPPNLVRFDTEYDNDSTHRAAHSIPSEPSPRARQPPLTDDRSRRDTLGPNWPWPVARH